MLNSFSSVLGCLKLFYMTVFIIVARVLFIYSMEAGLPYAYVYVSVRKSFFIIRTKGTAKMDKDMKKYPYNLLRQIFPGEQMNRLAEDSEMVLEYLIAENLTEQEVTLLRMRYRKDMTYTDIGDANNLSRGRVKDIIVKAERKLSHYARKKYIEMGMRKYIEYIKESTRVCRENQYKKRINRLEREIAELRHENYAPDNAEIYNEGIEIFDMTVRTYNVLQRNGLHTVGDIIEADSEKIISIKNLGRKSLEELIEVLKEYGFEAKSMELIRCYENHHLI